MRCGKLIDSFLLAKEASGLSEDTVEFYEFGLKALQGVDSQDFDANTIRRILIDCRESGYKPRSVHAVYRSIRAFCNWLSREMEDERYSKAIDKVKAPKLPKDKQDAVPIEVVKDMLATCTHPMRDYYNARDGAVISLMIESGLRASEVTGLNVEDVNLETGAVNVNHGKGDKARVAVVGKDTLKRLDAWINYHREGPYPALFVSTNTDRRLTYSGLRGILERRAEKASVDYYPPHSYRRAWCMASLRAGMPQAAVQALGGWESEASMRPYIKLVEADLQQMYVSPLD